MRLAESVGEQRESPVSYTTRLAGMEAEKQAVGAVVV